MYKDWSLALCLVVIVTLILIAESKSTCEVQCYENSICGNKIRCSKYCACKSLKSAVAGGHNGHMLEFANGNRVHCNDVFNQCKRDKRVKRIFTPDLESTYLQSEVSWQEFESSERRNVELQSARLSLKHIIRQILLHDNIDYYDWNSELEF